MTSYDVISMPVGHRCDFVFSIIRSLTDRMVSKSVCLDLIFFRNILWDNDTTFFPLSGGRWSDGAMVPGRPTNLILVAGTLDLV